MMVVLFYQLDWGDKGGLTVQEWLPILNGMKRTPAVIFLLLAFFALSTPLFSSEQGIASYYAGKFQGRLTANGEIFDTNLFTAAHKTLPFNTIVKVTSDLTAKSVLVRITDRGPFVAGRIIDLSRAAAEAIEMVGSGLAPVTVEIVARGNGKTYHKTGPPSGTVSIQIGAFGDKENAIQVKEMLEANWLKPVLETAGRFTRVILPSIPTGNAELTRLRLAQLGFTDVLVRRS
jgi:peptidoglycan lytic transglycosylase